MYDYRLLAAVKRRHPSPPNRENKAKMGIKAQGREERQCITSPRYLTKKRQYLFSDTASCIRMSEMLMVYVDFFG